MSEPGGDGFDAGVDLALVRVERTSAADRIGILTPPGALTKFNLPAEMARGRRRMMKLDSSGSAYSLWFAL